MPPNPHLNREGLFVCFRRYVIHIKTLAPGDHNHLRVLVSFCKGKGLTLPASYRSQLTSDDHKKIL